MRKLIALSLATVVAATSIAATLTSASAHDRDDWRQRPHVIHRQDNDIVPFLFGSLFGRMLRHPDYDYYPSSRHVAWCLAHYRTYNPTTNTFFIRRGVAAVCVSPYSY